MPDNMTTTEQIDPAVQIFYNRVLLEDAAPNYVHDQWAEKYSIKRKSGKTMKMRRYTRLSAVTTPSVEGITPRPSRLAKVDILATCEQYIGVIVITDQVDLTVEDPVITVAVEKASDQMHNSKDQLIRDYLVAGASSTTCSNGDAVATELNRTDIDSVVQSLLGGEAKFISKMVKASTGIGTSPLRPAFWGILDSDLIDDIEAVTGFRATNEYPSHNSVLDAEWGMTGNVRWLWTTQGYLSSGTYSLPIFGRNAYGIIDIEGGNANAIVKGFGSGDDPANQRATVSWKMWQVCRILNDAYLHVLKCTNG